MNEKASKAPLKKKDTELSATNCPFYSRESRLCNAWWTYTVEGRSRPGSAPETTKQPCTVRFAKVWNKRVIGEGKGEEDEDEEECVIEQKSYPPVRREN
jgi:hypothetical protein